MHIGMPININPNVKYLVFLITVSRSVLFFLFARSGLMDSLRIEEIENPTEITIHPTLYIPTVSTVSIIPNITLSTLTNKG